MATLYLDVTAPHDGDGTLKTHAASAGAPGCRDSLYACLVGGPLIQPGDEVHVRTHDGVSDLTEVISTTLVMSTTFGDPLDLYEIIFDDGTEWPDSGKFTLRTTVNSNAPFRFSNGRFRGARITDTEYRFNVEVDGLQNTISTFTINGCHFIGTRFWKRHQPVGNAGSQNSIAGYTGSRILLEDCRMELNANYKVQGYGNWIVSVACLIEERNSIWDYTNFAAKKVPPDLPLMKVPGAGSQIRAYGCRYINTPPNAPLIGSFWTNSSSVAGKVVLDTCDLPTSVDVFTRRDFFRNTEWTFSETSSFEPGSFTRIGPSCIIHWKSGENLPTQSATLPDGSPWVLKVLPSEKVSEDYPAVLAPIKTVYTAPDAVVTLDVEMAIKDTSGAGSGGYDNPTKRDWWFEIMYIDAATGDRKVAETPRDGTPLDVSTATWVPEVGGNVSYGPDKYNKHKLTLTTPTAVKQGTVITCTVKSARPALDPSDFYFVNPTLSIT